MPNILDVRLGVEIREQLAEAFERQRIRRNIFAVNLNVELRRRPHGQGVGDVARERRAGIFQFVALIKFAQRIHGRPVQCFHPRPKLHAPRRPAAFRIEAGGIERAHRRKKLQARLNVDRPFPCRLSRGTRGHRSTLIGPRSRRR